MGTSGEVLASGDCWTSWIQVFVGVSLYVCIVHVHCIDFFMIVSLYLWSCELVYF